MNGPLVRFFQSSLTDSVIRIAKDDQKLRRHIKDPDQNVVANTFGPYGKHRQENQKIRDQEQGHCRDEESAPASFPVAEGELADKINADEYQIEKQRKVHWLHGPRFQKHQDREQACGRYRHQDPCIESFVLQCDPVFLSCLEKAASIYDVRKDKEGCSGICANGAKLQYIRHKDIAGR